MSELKHQPERSQSRLSTAELHTLIEQLSRLEQTSVASEQVERIELLERIKSAAAAAQARETAHFAVTQVRETEPARREAAAQGRRLPDPGLSIAAQVALARRESPYAGQQHTRLAEALTHDLPHTMESLRIGDISEDRAMIIATETHDLSAEDRRRVDAELFASLSELGDKQLRDAVRRATLRIDAAAAERRQRRARAERRVTGRLLGDGTGRICAVVKQEHYAAVIDALGRAATSAKAAGDPRTRDQLKADTLVSRITWTDAAEATPVAVRLVLGAETLFGTSNEPGDVGGFGPIPAYLCRELVHSASKAGRAAIKRLFSMPGDHELVAMESRSRKFGGELAEFIGLRDGGTCRTAWCNTPLRHIDHPVPVREGGQTTANNGQGLCESCNYVKESPGWLAWVGPAGEAHTVGTMTPSQHVYTTHPPPLPRPHEPPRPAHARALPDGWTVHTLRLQDYVLTA